MNTYLQLLDHLDKLQSASSSRALESEEWLEAETENNPQMHFLLRQAIIDPNVADKVKLISVISLNNHLLNLMNECPYDQLFSFTRELVRDPNFSQTYFQHLHRFMVQFISKAQKSFIQDWLMLYKEILLQGLTIRALNILSFFSVSEIEDSDFIYFIDLAVPWAVQRLGCEATITNSLVVLEWSKAMTQVVNKLIEKKVEVFKENAFKIAQNAEIAKLIVSCYELQSDIQNGYLTTKSSLQELNILKGSVAQLHSLLLLVYRQSRKSIRQTLSESLLIQTVPRLCRSLMLISKDFDKYNEAFQSSEFTKNIIKIFTNSLATTECEGIFSVFASKLVSEVIFPAFVFNEVEETSFEESNQEFVLCIEDIIGKHQSQTLKSLLAALLEQISDWIPGIMTQVVNHAVNSLKINLNIIQKVPNQLVLNNLQSLIIIGIFGYICQQRTDIAQLFGEFFAYNSEVILKSFSPIELAVLYVVLDYSGGEFKFPKQDYSFVYMKHASICKDHPTTEFAALSFLSSKISSVNSIEILRILIQRTQNCGYGLIWTILQNFVSNNLSQMSEQVAIELVNVILNQIDRLSVNPDQITNYSTMQCLNILKQLCNPKANFLKSKGDLRSAIFKVFQLFKVPNCLNTDDVIEVLCSFVKGRKQVDPIIYDLFPDINARLKEKDNLFFNLFPFINFVILRGNFEMEDQRLLLVLEWCIRPLGFESFREFERAESLLLLQLFLDKYLHLLSPVTIVQTLSLLNQHSAKLSQPPAHLRLLVTNILFYTAPINFPKVDLIKKLLSVKFANQGYSSTYMKILTVIFLFKVIYAENQGEIITFVMTGIVNLLSKWNEKNKAKSTKKKDQILAYNLQQYKQSVSKLTSSYKKIEIFGYFSDRIKEMRAKNANAFQEIFQSLSEETREKMRKVMGQRQMANEEKPRVIFKIKGVKEEVVIDKEGKALERQKMMQEKKNMESDGEGMEVEGGSASEGERDHDIKAKKSQKKTEKTKKRGN